MERNSTEERKRKKSDNFEKRRASESHRTIIGFLISEQERSFRVSRIHPSTEDKGGCLMFTVRESPHVGDVRVARGWNRQVCQIFAIRANDRVETPICNGGEEIGAIGIPQYRITATLKTAQT